MATYEIKAYREVITYEKCWIEIEAETEEKALAFAKKNPDECEYIDGKTMDINDGEWVEQNQWTATKIKD